MGGDRLFSTVLLVSLELAAAAPAASQPSAVDLPPIATQPSVNAPLEDLANVYVRAFAFKGNSRFKDQELLAAPLDTRDANGGDVATTTVKDLLNKELTLLQLEDVRQALTRYYVNHGFINSGAVLPEQTVDEGTVVFQIVEGRLTGVELRPEHTRLRRSYVLSRIERGTKGTLNVIRLKESLEQLRRDPNIKSINAELRPGVAPGEAYLEVRITEPPHPWQLGARFSNSRPPSVGAEQLDLLVYNHNLTGNGDLLALRYGMIQGGIGDAQWAGDDDFSIDYSIPVTPSDTSVSLGFSRTNSPVIEETFNDLDIDSRTDSVTLSVRQPFMRRVYEPSARGAAAGGGNASLDVAGFVTLGYRRNETFLLGEPFSFSPGAQEGKTTVFAIRLGQELTVQNERQAIALRSTFGFGTNLFNANDGGADDVDSQFFVWLGQSQYVRRLGRGGTNLIGRLTAQLTPDPLPAIEQFSIGGIDTVRGYHENQIVRDNAVVGCVELHVPLYARPNGDRVLELVPFVDGGYGWNHADDPGDNLASVGVGLEFTPNENFSAQLYYGYALRRDLFDDGNGEEDLQDWGLHFNVTYLWF